MHSNDVKAYLKRIIDTFDSGQPPKRPGRPTWLQTMAGPAALGLALGLGGGCATDDPNDMDRDAVRQGKADGFIDDWCTELGAEPGCDICLEAGWYGDGACDDFCNFPDIDCGGLGDIVALYSAPPPDPWPCFDDDACPPGFECREAACPDGVYCIMAPQGECVVSDRTECNSHADCTTGEYCKDHNMGGCPEGAFCIMPPSAGECMSDPMCTSNEECPTGMECVDINACPEGVYCIMPPSPGQCQVTCNANDQCPTGEVCVDGVVGSPTCQPESRCHDGTTVSPLCDMAPVCEDGLIQAIQDGCFECVDPHTCEPPTAD